jgi:hypothetical protein
MNEDVKATVLPNPLAKREQCVKQCLGCNKMYSGMEMKSSYGKLPEGDWKDDCIGDVCIAYEDPKGKWKNHSIEEVTKKIKGKDAKVTLHFNPCVLASHAKHHIEEVSSKKRVGQQKQK